MEDEKIDDKIKQEASHLINEIEKDCNSLLELRPIDEKYEEKIDDILAKNKKKAILADFLMFVDLI